MCVCYQPQNEGKDRSLEIESKVCAVCSKVFTRNFSTNSYNWNRQKTCCKKCQARNKQITKTKICIICKTEFSKSACKSNKVWEAQECCGKDCSAISRRKEGSSNTKFRMKLTPGARRF